MNIFHSDTYDRLSEKQKKAVDAYIENGFNVKDAAAKSGYNAASLSRWLKTEKARVCLKDYTLFLIDNKKDVLEYRIIDIYITRAFYNPADIIDKDGFLITDDLKSLGPLACCVEGIETEIKGVRIIKDKDGNEKEVKLIKKKVKLCDREKALEMLSRYMQLITDKMEVSGQVNTTVNIWSLSTNERKARIKELLKKGKINGKNQKMSESKNN